MSAEAGEQGDWNGFNTRELMEATKELQAKKKRQRKPITAAPWFQDRKTHNNHDKNQMKGEGNVSEQKQKEDKSSDPTRCILRGGKPNAIYKRMAFSKGANSHRTDTSSSVRQQSHRESTWRGSKANSLISPETVMSAVNRKMKGFAQPTQLIIDRDDAQSLVPLLSDRRVVNSNGRQVAKRVVNVLDKLCAFLSDQKYRPLLKFKKGDENSSEFWDRAAKEYTAWVRPSATDAKMSGSVLCKLMMGFTRLRKEQLATQNGGGTQAPGLVPGLAVLEEEEQVQAGDTSTSKLERRIQGGIDKWILYLDVENDAAIDLSIFSKLGL